MKFGIKTGSRFPSAAHPKHATAPRDGQIVEILPDSAVLSENMLKKFAWFEVPIAVPNFDDSNIKKLISAMDSGGKYPWEAGYNGRGARFRDYFIDLTAMQVGGGLTVNQLNDLYNKDLAVNPINLGTSIVSSLRHEDQHSRTSSTRDETQGSISSGDHEIGDGADYNTLTLFNADLIALTAACRALHRNEITAVPATIEFGVATGGYLLSIMPLSGAEHDGTFGSGATVDFANFDSLSFTDDCIDVDFHDLCLDCEGSSNSGISFRDFTTTGGDLRVFRNLIRGNASSTCGLYLYQGLTGNAYYLMNNAIWGFAAVSATWNTGRAIAFHGQYSSHAGDFYLLNNTFAKCNFGITIYHANAQGTHTWKNNFGQGAALDDNYVTQSALDYSAGNISEDATSPQEALRSLDKHSKFQDYASDEYDLQASDSDIDSGEDLSGTFPDDFLKRTRSVWRIGCADPVLGRRRVPSNPSQAGLFLP